MTTLSETSRKNLSKRWPDPQVAALVVDGVASDDPLVHELALRCVAEANAVSAGPEGKEDPMPRTQTWELEADDGEILTVSLDQIEDATRAERLERLILDEKFGGRGDALAGVEDDHAAKQLLAERGITDPTAEQYLDTLAAVLIGPAPRLTTEPAPAVKPLGYDCVSKEQYAPDAERVNLIVRLVEHGYRGQILLSGDLARRSYLEAWGGSPGYRYLLESFVSRLRAAGLDEETVRCLLVDNPSRFLAWR